MVLMNGLNRSVMKNMGNYNRKVNEMDSKDEKDGFMSVQEDEELPFE